MLKIFRVLNFRCLGHPRKLNTSKHFLRETWKNMEEPCAFVDITFIVNSGRQLSEKSSCVSESYGTLKIGMPWP